MTKGKGASKNLGKALTNRKNGADPGLTSTDLAELGADNGEAIDKESGILDLLAQEMKRVDESDDDNDDDYCPDEEVEDIDEHPDRAVEPLKGVTVNVKNEGDGESKLDARLKARNLDGSIPAQNGRYHGRKLVMWHRKSSNTPIPHARLWVKAAKLATALTSYADLTFI